MNLRTVFIISGCLLSINSIAGTMGPIPSDAAIPFSLPWIVIGSLGYTNYSSVSECRGEGQTPFGRFAIARELVDTRFINLGLELGLQSRNTMTLEVP